jgi:hypothetical protein
VFLWRTLLDEAWAREVAQLPGVHVIDEPAQVMETLERLDPMDAVFE